MSTSARVGMFNFGVNHIDTRAAARGLLQSASLTAPSEREPRGALRRRGRAVDERLDGVGRKCVQNSRRDVGIAPYAKFWIGRNNYHLCVGRAALSPPVLAFSFTHIAS